MTKDIKTLEADIAHVLTTGEGWTTEISKWVADDISKSLERQLTKRKPGDRARNLRVSNLGTQCERKLWYHVNSDDKPEPLSSSTLSKFVFGDLTESYVLGLCKAAGHSVEGLQDTVDVCGIRGSRDCVIDGMLIDVKSASSRAFDKFKYGKLREDDPFGYISQLSSYLYGSRDDPLVTNKKEAGFLVVDKQFGHITLDIYDLSDDIKNKEQEVAHKKSLVKQDKPPEKPKWPRYYRGELQEEAEDWEDGKSGNRKLSTPCSYCEWKKTCFPDLRKFVRANSVQYLTKVVREPSGAVFEDTNYESN